MKIGVVGAGAVGLFYGARLARAEEEVHFLIRSGFDSVRERGVRVLSPEGDFHLYPPIARLSAEIGPCDLVLIALKSTANHLFSELITPLLGPGTRLFTLQNGLGNEETLAALFGPERVLGGLAFVCLNRDEPGIVRHIAHGKITLGEHGRPAGEFARRLAAVLEAASVTCKLTDHLEHARWVKLVWNIPFNGLGVASSAGLDAVLKGDSHARVTSPCLPTDALLADPRWEELVRGLMLEVIQAAKAAGHPIEEAFIEAQIADTKLMGAYKPSSVIDFEKGLPIELQAIFLEPLRRARAAGSPSPLLEKLCNVLTSLARNL